MRNAIIALFICLYLISFATLYQTTQADKVWRDPVTGMEFVWVPGGCYEMGCGSWDGDCYKYSKPVHEVCVDGFWMGKFEVTQGQWKKVMGNNPSHFKKGDRHPVEKVCWNDAKEFIRKLTSMNQGRYEFRLPTEAEWEYACRSGGKKEKYSGGTDVNRLAWYSGNSGRSTHEVGTKAPNGLGIYDMSGNVWECCEDGYEKHAYSKHQRKNPIIEGSPGQVYRGGSWLSSARGSRSANRGSYFGWIKSYNVGFRLLRKL